MARKVYEIVYGSGQFISNPDELLTLACFYDSVWLPLPKGSEISEFAEWGGGNSHKAETWAQKHDDLFQEGVLKRIEPSEEQIEPRLKSFRHLLSRAPMDSSGTLAHYAGEFWWGAIEERHAEMELPTLFVPGGNITRASRTAAVLALESFRYFLPYLRAVPESDICDTIFKIREKTKGVREGYSSYLLELSREITSAINADSSYSEIAAAAENLIETKLGPQTEEYLRSVTSLRAGGWGRLLGPITAMLNMIFSGPGLIEALKTTGVSGLQIAEEISSKCSNMVHAQKFLGVVREEGTRLGG